MAKHLPASHRAGETLATRDMGVIGSRTQGRAQDILTQAVSVEGVLETIGFFLPTSPEKGRDVSRVSPPGKDGQDRNPSRTLSDTRGAVCGDVCRQVHLQQASLTRECLHLNIRNCCGARSEQPSCSAAPHSPPTLGPWEGTWDSPLPFPCPACAPWA